MSQTLNDLIIAGINGAEVDEREAVADISPIFEKTAAPTATDSDDIEKIASTLEWFATTGVEAFVELDKKASSPNLSEIKRHVEGGSSLTQAVALTHPTLHSEARAEIVEALGEKVAMSSYKKDKAPTAEAPAAEAPAAPEAKMAPAEESARVKGEQPDPRDPDADHHPALASNDSAIAYTKAEKAKHVSGSLQRILDAKPFADSGLKQNLKAAKSGIDKNIHAKTASDKREALAQVKAAIAEKLAQQTRR